MIRKGVDGDHLGPSPTARGMSSWRELWRCGLQGPALLDGACKCKPLSKASEHNS